MGMERNNMNQKEYNAEMRSIEGWNAAGAILEYGSILGGVISVIDKMPSYVLVTGAVYTIAKIMQFREGVHARELTTRFVLDDVLDERENKSKLENKLDKNAPQSDTNTH